MSHSVPRRHPDDTDGAVSSRDEKGPRGDVGTDEPVPRRSRPNPCGWCGRRLEGDVGSGGAGGAGRKRRYCGQSCRQRAYERRAAVRRGGLPADAVVFSVTELAVLQDRLFQLRCAAEDLVTAADEDASASVLRELAADAARAARDLEQLR